MTAPLPVCSAKLSKASSGPVSTTVGVHVGIPGVVLFALFAFTFTFTTYFEALSPSSSLE
jgi:hypothetical protein